MPQPAVFMLIGLAAWVIVSLAIARKWGASAREDSDAQSASPTDTLRTWADALCHRAAHGHWPKPVEAWAWAKTFDHHLASHPQDELAARRAMLDAASFASPARPRSQQAPKFYRLGTGLALLGLGLAMIAALGQLATIISQPSSLASTSDNGHQALGTVSLSQAGQVGVAALVLLGSAALMNLIARRMRQNAPDLRSSLHQKVQQSLAQSMASEAAAWIMAGPPSADTQPLADRLRQFWDVSNSRPQAPQTTVHTEQAA